MHDCVALESLARSLACPPMRAPAHLAALLLVADSYGLRQLAENVTDDQEKLQFVANGWLEPEIGESRARSSWPAGGL